MVLCILRALNYSIQIFDTTPGTKILVLNVIEWANDVEDSIDGELALKIEERDRKMLGSILVKDHIYKCERIVKLGDPASKIADMIIIGARGLGNTTSNLGSIMIGWLVRRPYRSY